VGRARAEELGLAELVAAVVDPGRPAQVLAAARTALAGGFKPWLLADAAGGGGARALNRSQARRLDLVAELVRRVEREGGTLPAPVQGPRDVLPHLLDIRASHQEKVVALYLDARNRPVHRELVSVGGLRASVIQPRDVLAPALRFPAAAIILAHNHPSGDTRPSPEDIDVTRQLAAAAALLGLALADHLVVSGSRFTSLRELGHLAP